jgi:hypothetical protein
VFCSPDGLAVSVKPIVHYSFVNILSAKNRTKYTQKGSEKNCAGKFAGAKSRAKREGCANQWRDLAALCAKAPKLTIAKPLQCTADTKRQPKAGEIR